MRTYALVAAAAFVVVGAIAGCDRTTPGTVSMTTEADSTIVISTPSRPTTSSSQTSAPQTSSDTPPAGDALSVTCAQYVGMDAASQTAVIAAILKEQTSVLSPGDSTVAKTLADAVCTFMPDSKVSEILLGETPP